jgi:hypothetical protein
VPLPRNGLHHFRALMHVRCSNLGILPRCASAYAMHASGHFQRLIKTPFPLHPLAASESHHRHWAPFQWLSLSSWTGHADLP